MIDVRDLLIPRAVVFNTAQDHARIVVVRYRSR